MSNSKSLLASVAGGCCTAAVFIALPLSLASGQASESNFHAGQWAAEAGIGGGTTTASVLRFSNDHRAWLFGVSGSIATSDDDRGSLFPSVKSTTGLVNARLGIRNYGAAHESIRPLWGIGVLGSVNQPTPTARLWGAGAYTEFGAAYFFNQSFSVGAAGQLDLQYQEQSLASSKTTAWELSLNLVRLSAALYF